MAMANTIIAMKIHEKTGGYNSKLFVLEGKNKDEVDHELHEIRCGICLEPWRNPHQCSNGHIYCESCTEPDRHPLKSCPECRGFVDHWIPNLFAKKCVETMNVKCLSAVIESTNNRGCNWHGQLHSLVRHVREDCLLTIVHCGFAGCYSKMKRGERKLHQSTCRFRLVNCVHCNVEVTAGERYKHQGECDFRMMVCDLGCGQQMIAKEATSHKALECVNTLVECSMFQLIGTCSGCDGRVKRKEAESHLTTAEALPVNFMNLLNAMSQLKRSVAHDVTVEQSPKQTSGDSGKKRKHSVDSVDRVDSVSVENMVQSCDSGDALADYFNADYDLFV